MTASMQLALGASSEEEAARADAMRYGVGYLVDGKRVEPTRVRVIHQERAVRTSPHARGSDTSRKAALENRPRAGSQRARVLAAIVQAGERGLTREELERSTGLGANTVRPRVWELLQGEWVIESQATRRTVGGADAHVLVAALKARQA